MIFEIFNTFWISKARPTPSSRVASPEQWNVRVHYLTCVQQKYSNLNLLGLTILKTKTRHKYETQIVYVNLVTGSNQSSWHEILLSNRILMENWNILLLSFTRFTYMKYFCSESRNFCNLALSFGVKCVSSFCWKSGFLITSCVQADGVAARYEASFKEHNVFICVYRLSPNPSTGFILWVSKKLVHLVSCAYFIDYLFIYLEVLNLFCALLFSGLDPD